MYPPKDQPQESEQMIYHFHPLIELSHHICEEDKETLKRYFLEDRV